MRGTLTALLMLFGARVTAAQVCSGFAPFEQARARVFADAAFSSILERYHGGLIYGRSRVFASAEVGMTTFATDEWLDFGVGAGLQLGPFAGGRLQVCPQAFVASTAGAWTDEFGSRIDYGEQTLSAGASGGYLLRRTKSTQLTATATMLLGGGRATRSFTSGFSRSTNIPSYASLALGLGFQLNKEATVIPSLVVPLGRHGGSVYRIRFSLRLGKAY